MSWEANSSLKQLLHAQRKSALLNLTWSGLLAGWFSRCRNCFISCNARPFQVLSPSIYCLFRVNHKELSTAEPPPGTRRNTNSNSNHESHEEHEFNHKYRNSS